MKILVLNGSPKRDKSDTMHITRAFLDGMKEAAPQDVHIIHTADQHIEYCTGCFSCMRNGGTCIHDDDMRTILEEILESDLLLRPFQESDYVDLFEFLLQLKDDEFEGYPGITYENGRSHLQQRLGSEAFYAEVWFHKDLKGTPVWKDTFVYAMLDTDKRGKC